MFTDFVNVYTLTETKPFTHN